MTRTVFALLAGWIVVIGAVSRQPEAAFSQQPAAAASPAPRALVDKYCVTCHNQRHDAAGRHAAP
jgi:cytochrome c5